MCAYCGHFQFRRSISRLDEESEGYPSIHPFNEKTVIKVCMLLGSLASQSVDFMNHQFVA